MHNVEAIILAAGEGTRMRMQSTDRNKVALELKGSPMIKTVIDTVRQSGIHNLIVVVGFAKESVITLLDNDIKVVEQTKRLGTGHAVKTALEKYHPEVQNILVLYGDDAMWPTTQIFQDLDNLHTSSRASVTFCTNTVDNPFGLGRIVRDDQGQVVQIVEEKNTTAEQKTIQEVNIGGFMFNKDFLVENIDQLAKNPISGEYYITDLIELAIKLGLKVETLKLNTKHHGINTPQELQAAEEM